MRLEPAFGVAPVAGRDEREGWDAAGDRATLCVLRPLGRHAPMVFGDHPQHRRGEPARRRVGANLPYIERDDATACPLHSLEDFPLQGKRAHEAVEVGNDEDLRLACLDHLDGSAQPRSVLERCATGHVEFLHDLDERKVVVLTSRPDTLALLFR